MADKEALFWERVQILAHSQLRQSSYDFFVSQAKLIAVEGNIARIQLDNSAQQLFWDTNLQAVILTAGFEVYDQEMKLTYQFSNQATNPIERESMSQIERPSVASSQVESYESLVKPSVNPKYTFSNFVQGEGNKWALSAALAVAEAPGTAYNPLFIWGGSGLGKTHLLNAIGNHILSMNPRARIEYITTDNFISEFVSHIRLNTMDELKQKFRNLDVLLIDDIQSLARKNLVATQEEFFNTFNSLFENQKQIVLTSDRTPEQLDDLPERLVSRFAWGLPVDITPPDYETRVAILNQKLQEYSHLNFKQEAIEYLANHFDSNVRELEGALKNVNLVATGKHLQMITVDTVVEALRSRLQTPSAITVIPIERIQAEVSKFYGVSVKEITGPKRVQHIALARQVAMYLSRELTDNSLPKIGKEFGNRDHSTVLHAYHKIREALETDENLGLEIRTIRQRIK
ncbi:chromosomal replication initiator protein DnaA [Streptococcus ovuberis]|uniref:Chromosomal replication initiator protein DnaA n=1 Tax=Streptococcus ovuberis TaxID=1936207 RepID=A0A7X6S1Q6_9STRE|nr:chromosomal replication initiator protein DnaA [Streptococcus ovuberis]NKZ20615.1 chromosomal replication initiator protein DnaA [Streptococcus ovuberis]